MSVPSNSDTYEWECLAILAHETSDDEPRDAERKIKARLRQKGLGPYDQAKVDRLRSLKNEVRDEFSLPSQRSRYFLGCKSGWADFADYNLQRLTSDLATRFPDIAVENIAGMVHLSAFMHYIR
jgi:hypothetical protein